MRSRDAGIALESRARFSNCMNALEVAAKTWRIAGFIHSSVTAVLGKPDHEDRLGHIAERQFSH